MDIKLKMDECNSKRRYWIYEYRNNFVIANTRHEAIKEFKKHKIKISISQFKNYINVVGRIEGNPYRIVFQDCYIPDNKADYDYEHRFYIDLKRKE